MKGRRSCKIVWRVLEGMGSNWQVVRLDKMTCRITSVDRGENVSEKEKGNPFSGGVRWKVWKIFQSFHKKGGKSSVVREDGVGGVSTWKKICKEVKKICCQAFQGSCLASSFQLFLVEGIFHSISVITIYVVFHLIIMSTTEPSSHFISYELILPINYGKSRLQPP